MSRRTTDVRDEAPRAWRSASASTWADQVNKKPSARHPAITSVRVTGDANPLASRKTRVSRTEELGLDVLRAGFGHSTHELVVVPLELAEWDPVVGADLRRLQIAIRDPA